MTMAATDGAAGGNNDASAHDSAASNVEASRWTSCSHSGGGSADTYLLGIAKNNFNQDKPHRLHLDLGDTVIILRENVNWYYGYKKKNKSQRGIFPKTYVQLVEAEVLDGEYSVLRSDFVKEVSTVLNDWRDRFKDYYLSRDENFGKLRNNILELIRQRSLILSGNLPVDELREVKLAATSVIDTGNSLLGLDMIVRDESGNVLDIGRTSTTHLYEQHVNAESRIRKANSSNKNRHSQTASKYSQNLLLSVHAFVCKFHEAADTLFTLYDGDTMKPITENFCVKWGVLGRPVNADQCDVLFTDLSSDLTTRRIYLICQVVRWGGMDAKVSDPKGSLVRKQSAQSMSAAMAAAASMASAPDGSGGPGQLRRPFGVAFYDLSSVLKNADNVKFPLALDMPYVPCEKENFDSTLRKLIASAGEKSRIESKLAISVNLLSGETKQITAMYGGVVLARKMGFPEVILPGEVRNDLYLTLVAGEFARGSKTSDKNIEVTVAVCNELGAVVPGVLSLGAGAAAVNEYRSVTYYHDDRPKWNETFRIQVSIEEFKQCHLRFHFKHRSSNKDKDKNEKPFGFAYVRLMQANGTALHHQQHHLVVYKMDQKKLMKDDSGSSSGAGSGSHSSGERTPPQYLQLPSLVGQLADTPKPAVAGLTLAPKDSFTIETNLCSTKLTQDVHLLGLLNWAADRRTIEPSLVALTCVSPEEVVKFLQDILDALFDILRESSLESVSRIDILVFDCLLKLIEIVDDKKYQHFQSVLDLYINESFSATLAYGKLISVLQKHIVDNLAVSNDGELYRPVRNLQYIIRFIIRSRILHANLEANRDHKEFEAMLRGLLDTFVTLTSSDKEMLRSQGTIVKFLHVITTDLMQVYSPVKLCEFIVEVIQKIPASRLVQSKRLCMKDLVNSRLFQLGECRAILLPVFCQQIRDKLDSNEEGDTDIRQQEKNLSKAAKILGENTSLLHSRETTTKIKISECLNIMNNILDLLFNGPTASDAQFGSTDYDITTIMNTLLRTVIQMASKMNNDNPLIRNMVAVMLGILRTMRLTHYQLYVRQFVRTELQTFLIQTLSVFHNLVSQPVFPAEWMDMIMHQNTVILDSLRHFTHIIMDHFFEPFEKTVWSTFFHCSIAFLVQPSLQLDRFVVSKRAVILQRYEDMRRRTADEIRHMWEKLGEHKPAFVLELVGPVVEMSLIPERELRKATIPIFFDMMQCEWFSSRLVAGSYGDTKRSTAHAKGSFEEFEKEMISKLDLLVESGLGDEEYRRLFERDMLRLCREHTVLCGPGVRFVQMVSGLLGRLLEYRAIMAAESKENRMACTVALLDYYKEVNRSEMCVRYVDKLVALHKEFENWAEAAFALRLHGAMVQWSDAPLSALMARRWPDCGTHRQLKEKLSAQMMALFDRAQLWECALTVCKELAHQYEHEVFDYRRLSETHAKLSQFYAKIMAERRHECEYFRVAFYGLRCPEFLRNRVYVYRGKQYERLSEFCTRLLQQHPAAELLQTMKAPGEEVTQADGQFILVNSVEPISRAAMVQRFAERNTEVAWYYRTNDVSRFKFSRPYRVPVDDGAEVDSDGIGSLWLERTEMVTRTSLPGILRWAEVKETTVSEISPLQYAIETMQLTNRIIRDLVIAHIDNRDLPINPLSLKISGVVDAAVMGGLAKYEEAFLIDAYLLRHPDSLHEREHLKSLIADQIPLLEVALRVHRAKASSDLAPLQEQLETCFAKMQASVEQRYGKRFTDLRFEPETAVTMRRPASSMLSSAAAQMAGDAANRYSETSVGSSDSGFANRSQATSIKSTFNFAFTSGNLSRTSLGNSPSTKTKTKDKTPNKRRSSKKIDRESASLSLATSQWYAYTSAPHTPTAADTFNIASDAVSMDAVSTTSTITMPVVELTEELMPQRPLRSEVERERRLSRPTSTITPTSSVKGMLINSGDTHSLSGESSNRNSIVTTDSTASEDDNVPPPLPAKMRESSDCSSFDASAFGAGGHHGESRASLGRSLSMSVGSGRYTNKPLPAVPTTAATAVSPVNSAGGVGGGVGGGYNNAAYDVVETSDLLHQQQQARMRRAPPTPPPKPSRGSKALSQAPA